MILPLGPRRGGPVELLFIGAHSDDIEIGCGGTILRLLKELPVSGVTWVVLSGNEARADEARRSARKYVPRRTKLRILQGSFRESYFPYLAADVKEFFDRLGREVRPDIVFTHYREDRHQDHRLLSELTYNTFRDHLIFEYEIIKLDGDIGNPNVYVSLDAATVRRKVKLVVDAFGTQRDKRWFSEDVFRGLLRIRGVEAGAPSGYAEAFYGRKIVL
jgi:LmbE family N-acetylglucosaminyl deacetylase